jgi:hypothetical protein
MQNLRTVAVLGLVRALSREPATRAAFWVVGVAPPGWPQPFEPRNARLETIVWSRVPHDCLVTRSTRWPGRTAAPKPIENHRNGSHMGGDIALEGRPAHQTADPGLRLPSREPDPDRCAHMHFPSGPGIGAIRPGSISIQTTRSIACMSVGGVLTRSRRSDPAGRTTYSQYSPR